MPPFVDALISACMCQGLFAYTRVPLPARFFLVQELPAGSPSDTAANRRRRRWVACGGESATVRRVWRRWPLLRSSGVLCMQTRHRMLAALQDPFQEPSQALPPTESGGNPVSVSASSSSSSFEANSSAGGGGFSRSLGLLSGSRVFVEW